MEKVGGRVYLVDLVEQVASTANIASYANIVLEKSILRKLINTSNEIVKSCYSQEQAVDDLLDQAEQHIFQISQTRIREGFIPIANLVNQTLEQIDSHSMATGLLTGFDKLDEMTLGLHPGDFVVIAGRPSMGKTSLAMNIAENVATRKDSPTGVGIFSVEMSREQLVFRMLCGRAGINQHELRANKLRDSEWQKLAYSANSLSSAPIFIDDAAALTPLEMRAKARRLKAQYNVGLFIIDYIQLMHTSGFSENRQQEMSLISRNLKALAKELHVPVVALSQLSRAVEQRGGDKRPQLADLRESGAIEQDADLVMFVFRQELYIHDKQSKEYKDVEGRAEIIVAKQRNGPTGMAELTFLKNLSKFENLEHRRRDLPPGVEPVGGDMPF